MGIGRLASRPQARPTPATAEWLRRKKKGLDLHERRPSPVGCVRASYSGGFGSGGGVGSFLLVGPLGTPSLGSSGPGGGAVVAGAPQPAASAARTSQIAT